MDKLYIYRIGRSNLLDVKEEIILLRELPESTLQLNIFMLYLPPSGFGREVSDRVGSDG